ncbi:phage terminase small subunit [Sphingomonas sp. CBMAI 2297]|uniref:phage terminase small subunit n=1 Tax=Sphingomonas sp. CBMAI 2297 TaxID=2991720 RepID=UPI0024572737|nr:phage terminase small subunit [Sphingomonas sp. CBMAI 2297]MDH4743165.1 phage terminase small subunit [Sphingomonas sp. CBMAI 2297]
MSLARKHRDSFSALITQAAAPSEASGLATDTTAPASASAAPSLARAHRDRALAEASAVEQVAVASVAETGTEAERAAAQMNLRLQADLRRLRDIKSIEKKIETKRELLPHYAAWVDGLVAAGVAAEEDVLPTIMIWRIDTEDFAGAMVLAEHVLEHALPLPARYERSAPDLIVEEIASGALKIQQANTAFEFEILAHLDMLTADLDMHDEIRAKLKKAIGVEQMRGALNADGDAIVNTPLARLALETLGRARSLNQRVGVSDRIKKLTKLLPPPESQAPASA